MPVFHESRFSEPDNPFIASQRQRRLVLQGALTRDVLRIPSQF
jgi:hypothetical protein